MGKKKTNLIKYMDGTTGYSDIIYTDNKCSDGTFYKQECLKKILETEINIIRVVLKKNKNKNWLNQNYLHMDITTSCGICEYPEGNSYNGSPFIFLDLVDKYRSLNFKVIFMEKNKGRFNGLWENMFERYTSCGFGSCWPKNVNLDEFNVVRLDYQEDLLPYIEYLRREKYLEENKKQFGTLYVDPYGTLYPNALIELSNESEYKTLDFIFHVNGSIKRPKGLNKYNVKEKRTYREMIKQIKKDKWIIREPYVKGQYTFLIGTNFKEYPAFKKLGFHCIESNRGQEILDRIDLNDIDGEFENKYHKKFIYNNKWIESINKGKDRKEDKKIIFSKGVDRLIKELKEK